MQTEVLNQGLVLMGAGMGIVFIFLYLLVLVMRMIAIVVPSFNHLLPDDAPKPAFKRVASDDETAVAVAIAVAVARSRG